ncbi:hypothetical protein [Evansella tamaricis]|uniref:Uncharacterized protein n=1 Tax=Evansella tamaricis TaxID=2069301 RepID=A0ABS6JH90_9BACI|nr:hypothetical protein [Evansella tamaricis]MBU9713041.1 hypothetical protein [Evansella tamaricis]
MDYNQYWVEINHKSNEVNSLVRSYWHDYSHTGTWQFWFSLILLVLPVIILFFTVDRKRVFELLFYGYTVHILWTYISIPLERGGYFIHTYFVSPLLPFSLNMTASVIPVSYILLYQYCTNRKKNFYLYAIIVGAIFGFGISSIEAALGLVEFGDEMSRFYLFIICSSITIFAYWATRFVLWFKHR